MSVDKINEFKEDIDMLIQEVDMEKAMIYNTQGTTAMSTNENYSSNMTRTNSSRKLILL